MITITDLYIYPVKSCAPIRVEEVDLWETGPAFDRYWMLIDDDGKFLSQRNCPGMAKIQPSLRFGQLRLEAPGMLALDVPIQGFDFGAAERVSVQVWYSSAEGFVEPDVVNQWFSTFLGRPCRVLRFDPDYRRVCDRDWTGDDEAITHFTDGFPLLVTSRASLDELNRRLEKVGEPAVEMIRFRPNIVIDGVEPYAEEDIEYLRHENYTLRLVKPCERCPMPNLDLATGRFNEEPTRTLREYHLSPGGKNVLFGINGIITAGADTGKLRVGDVLEAE